MTPTPLSRRTLLRRGSRLAGGLAVAGLGGSLVGGCGFSESDKTSTSSFAFQLGWLANAENMGIFMAAEKGHFAAHGLSAKVVPGGPSVSVGPLVAGHKALVGLDSADSVARARNEGARLRIVGATLQKNPSAVMSLATSPIESPRDLLGKRLGIQQSGQAIYDAFFEANDVDPGDVEYVPVQFDPSPLVNGDVDAFASFQTVQPLQLRQQGIDTSTFLLADFGYAIWADTFVVDEATLADAEERDLLVRVMRASVQGWQDAVADPEEGARLAVEKYGKDLKLDLGNETLAARAFVPLVRTAETRRSGLLTMSPAGIAANIETMRSVGIEADADDLFDTSVLDDAFAGATSL